MKKHLLLCVATVVLLLFSNLSFSQEPNSTLNLGILESYEAFTADGSIVNVGGSVTGDVGSHSGGVITGLTSPPYTGNKYTGATDPLITNQARYDLLRAYIHLNSKGVNFPNPFAPFNPAHSPVFGSENLAPGVYSIGSAGSISGILTLNGGGNPDAAYVIKINGALTVDAAAEVILTGGTKSSNVFWIINGAISVGADAKVKGTLFSKAGAVGLGARVTLEGRMFSLGGAIDVGTGAIATPPLDPCTIPVFCESSCSPTPAANILGVLSSYTLFAKAGPVGNTGLSGINGTIGTNAGAIGGYASGVHIGTEQIANALTSQAATDIDGTYNSLMAMTPTVTNHAASFLNETLAPGVYHIGIAGALGGTIILDANNDPDAIFVFRFAGALNIASYSKIILTKGARVCNVFWVGGAGPVGAAVNIGASCDVQGTFLAHGGACNSGAGLFMSGRQLSTLGAVNTDNPIIYNSAECVTSRTLKTTAIIDNLSVAAGATTPSVIDNDISKGVQAVIGTAAGQVTLTFTNTAQLTMNPDGTISVAANASAGTYQITYTITEVSNTAIFSTVTSTVTVNVPAPTIVAVVDTPSALAGNNTSSVIANDTVNGVPVVIGTSPGQVTLTSTNSAQLTMNANGTIAIVANTPAGTYPISYTICEVDTPANCSTVTSNVTVTAPAIAAVVDAPSALAGANASSVISNDTVNGVQAVIGTDPGEVTLTSTDTAQLTMNLATGTIAVVANTPAGTYSISYTICEVNTPANCSTVTTNVTVTAPAIVAVADIPSALAGTNTPSVITNDTVNGVPLVIGTDPGEVILTFTNTADLTMNADGTIAVVANTPAGTYSISYTICEINNPLNCSTVTTNVTVTAPAILAVVDAPSVLAGANTSSVIGNDTVNGVQAVIGTDPGEVTLTFTNSGPLTMNADGTIAVAANTPAGDYTITYTICEVSNPANCSAVTTVTVTITAPAIVAVVDTPSVLAGTNTPSVIVNDTLNGVQAVIGTNPGEVTLTFTDNSPLTMNADGTIDVAASIPAGDYTITYTICEVNNIANCSAVTTVTVTVTAPAIVAVVDTPSVLAGTNTPSVIANDTVNGVPVVIGTSPGQVTLTSTNTAQLTMNVDGTIAVVANTPAGTYPISYTICEVNNPLNCSTVTTNVTVTSPAIVAVADTPSTLAGTNTSSVIANDTVNGVLVVIGTAPGQVTLTSTNSAQLTMNLATGTIAVVANTPAGTYPISYTICEVNTPANCSTVTTNVTVTAPAIVAVADTPSTLAGTNTSSVIANDTVNGVPVVIGTSPGQVTLTSTNTAQLTMNLATGTIAVVANTPAGTYPISYTICEVNTPANCSTVTTNVTVTAPVIVAVADAPSALAGTNTSSVIANDTVNGVPVVIGTSPGQVTLTATNTAQLTMNLATGTIAVVANTPAGTYPISYTICEVNNPSNCSTVTTNVTVTAPAIVAVVDAPITLAGTNTSSVIVNDTVNGVPVVIGTSPGQVTLTATNTAQLTMNLATGTIAVVANTPAGTYPISYTICEVNNPNNCSAVTTVTVTVTAPAIVAVVDTPSALAGTNTSSVIANDTVNGVPVVIGTSPGQVTLTFTDNSPLTMNADGTIAVASNAPAGDYTITYTICEVNNIANCSAVTTVTVTVTAPEIVAVVDNPSVLTGTNTSSVIANDTVNGVPVVIGTSPGQVTLTSTNTAQLTMNVDGTIAVAANAPLGTYPISYTICEVNNPLNCSTVTTNVTVSSPAGTLDCTKTQIIQAPVQGVANQVTLVVTMNVTVAGNFQVSMSGSGMSLANGITYVTTTTTGVQTFNIPMKYDGTTLSTLTFTVNSNSCTADLSLTKKKVLIDVWILDNCAIKIAPPVLN